MSAPLPDLSRRQALTGLVTLSAATAVTVFPGTAEGAHSGDAELNDLSRTFWACQAALDDLDRQPSPA